MKRTQPGKTLRDRYGGFDWVATFLGFAVAIFFLTVLLGIVGAIVGSVGYQIGAEVPKVGGPSPGQRNSSALVRSVARSLDSSSPTSSADTLRAVWPGTTGC
ncbi:hypothetical protein [Candidatus Nephthysia bennettiae]|uniref:Uncharacterized protein n=1 Tax=Candidatus Nephthysia bennettiae TaxID=3127016 RepID=A0A934K787_9BACT|nr:hypothetical protein [Candidatus Dormibacteraeota bacterium]MBJ7610754.1 hypothetical protein [Candidatus Dormibacteraeota bacterium]